MAFPTKLLISTAKGFFQLTGQLSGCQIIFKIENMQIICTLSFVSDLIIQKTLFLLCCVIR